MKRSKIKSILFKVLDQLPNRLGFALYHKIQERYTSSVKEKVEANKKTNEKVTDILCEKGGLRGKNILEIGSGWMPLMPYFFRYTGDAKKIFTYDINQHYNNKYIDELNTIFYNEFGFKVKVKVKQEQYHLPSFVEYHPKSNVITSQLPDNIDLIFSRFVLEHVTPNDLQEMHKRFFKELKDEVYILHLISPSDHRAYTDKSISHYDFLKYSQKQWDNIQTKFDYHNRLRLPQYLKIFEESGFEIVYLEYDKVDLLSEKYKKFKSLNIHDDFAKFSEEEILAGSINVLLRKKRN